MNLSPDSFRRPTTEDLQAMEKRIEEFQANHDSLTEEQIIAFAAEVAPFFASQANNHAESNIGTVRTR